MPSCCSFLGCSLRPLDLEFMKHLSKVVNIIPVIAKADTMTLEEKIEFKQRVSISAPVSFLPDCSTAPRDAVPQSPARGWRVSPATVPKIQLPMALRALVQGVSP